MGQIENFCRELRRVEDVNDLNEEEREVIRKALSSIHHHGFVHKDVRKENILIKRDHDRFHACFIDFTFSKEAESQYDFRKEMESLGRLLAQL